jgi:hypothetical protein
MVRKRIKADSKRGYRAPRTIKEQRMWDSWRPDYRAWSLKKKLSVDEAAALAMGLDPSIVEGMPHHDRQMQLRFSATREWLTRHKEDLLGAPIDLLGLSVIGGAHYGLALPPELSQAALYASEGFYDQDKLVAGLERQNKRLKDKISELNAKLAANADLKRNRPKASALTNTEKTSSKIIVALMAYKLDEAAWKIEFSRIKNHDRSTTVKKVVDAALLLGWRIDEGTVLARFKEALQVWDPADA